MLGIRLPDSFILVLNRKNDNDITICCHDVIVKLFRRCFVSLVKFSYCSGVMKIFFYKGLTRNLEIGNTPVWVLLNIWSLGQVRNTKFGTEVSNEMLLNAAKCQGYRFFHFWVIKGKPTKGLTPPPTQIKLICYWS